MKELVLILAIPLLLVACGNGPVLAQPESPTTSPAPRATATRCLTPTAQPLAQATATLSGPAGADTVGSGGTVTGQVVPAAPPPERSNADAVATRDALFRKANPEGPPVETAVVPEGQEPVNPGDLPPDAMGQATVAPAGTVAPLGTPGPVSPGPAQTPHLSPNNAPGDETEQNPCP